MKKLRFTALTVLISLLLVSALPVNAFASSALTISVSCPDSVVVGSEIRVRITVSKPANALSGLEFSLSYDSTLVSPKVTDNTSSQMNIFTVACPSGWEQMSSYSASESKYYLRYAKPEGSGGTLNSASQLILEIPFAVIAAGNISFSADSADIVAVGADAALTLYGGTGSTAESVSGSENEKVSVTLSGADTAPEGGIYELTATVMNISDTSGIIAVEFTLAYDKSVFSPVTTENGSGQMDAFMRDMPGDGWEQMCSLDADAGMYTLRFAALHAGSDITELLTAGSSFRAVIPFRVTASEGETGSFSADGESLVAVNANTGIVGGAGSGMTAAVAEGKKLSLPNGCIYSISGKYLVGVNAGTAVTDFLRKVGSAWLVDKNGESVSTGLVRTGYLITDGENLNTVIVRGDISGNGYIGSADYLMVKRAVLGTYALDPAQTLAGALTDGQSISAADYLKLKRHVLGTFNIFGE